MNDFRAEPDEIRTQQLAVVEKVFGSGWYVLGKEVLAFETAWAQACGAKFAVGTGNGMDALEIGLRALDIGPGAEVITTPMTAIATVLAIIRAGATPVLADIDPKTGLLDPHSVERCITSRTRALLLVHLYGQVHQMDLWQSLCLRRDIFLLEDCAQSHLAAQNNQVAGTFGSWGAYSFYPTRNLGAVGDGGALITNSEHLAARARVLRDCGQSQRCVHEEVGLNSRLDELQAAILSVRMQWLEQFTSGRRAVAGEYFNGITNPAVRLLAKPAHAENHVYHLFVVRCDRRAELQQFLKAQGVETLIHYPVPAHRQACCRGIRCDAHGLPHAEQHAAECLSLPCHPQLSDEDVRTVIEAVNAFR